MERRPQEVREKVSPGRAQAVPLGVAVDQRTPQPVLPEKIPYIDRWQKQQRQHGSKGLQHARGGTTTASTSNESRSRYRQGEPAHIYASVEASNDRTPIVVSFLPSRRSRPPGNPFVRRPNLSELIPCPPPPQILLHRLTPTTLPNNCGGAR